MNFCKAYMSHISHLKSHSFLKFIHNSSDQKKKKSNIWLPRMQDDVKIGSTQLQVLSNETKANELSIRDENHSPNFL